MTTQSRGGLRRMIPAVVAAIVLLVAWQLGAMFGPWPDYLFPGPLAVARSVWALALEGKLWRNLYVTMRRLLYGFGISIVIGGVLAFFMARYRALRSAVNPYLLGFQSLPSIAWVPLAILWFGFSEEALIFVTVIGSIFAVALAFTDALGSVRPSHIQAARNMGSRGMDLIVRVSIPAALPPLVSGAKQCWSFAWRSLVGAEIIFASVGLGFLLNQGRELLDVAQVFAVMLATLFLGLLFEVLVFANIEAWVKRRWGLLT